MATDYRRRTNQTLSFVRLQLDAIEQLQQQQDWNQALRVRALREALLFHLNCALSAYCAEIADQYRVRVASPVSIESLHQAFADQERQAAEIDELQQLLSKRGSFIERLARVYQQCWDAEAIDTASIQVQATDAASTSQISLVQIDSAAPDSVELDSIDRVDLHQLFSQLQELISRQRAAMQEW